jgi:hypothetical protein
MKTLSVLLVGACFTGLSQLGMAVSQSNPANAPDPTPPAATKGSTEVRTSDVGYATPEMLKLDPQVVLSQGGSLRPGPHNRHFRPPHGGPVTVGDRSEVPGRE